MSPPMLRHLARVALATLPTVAAAVGFGVLLVDGWVHGKGTGWERPHLRLVEGLVVVLVVVATALWRRVAGSREALRAPTGQLTAAPEERRRHVGLTGEEPPPRRW